MKQQVSASLIFFASFTLSLLLTGCVPIVSTVETYGLEEEVTSEQVAKLTADLRRGEARREELHRSLGMPFARSESWGIELYRTVDKDTYSTVLFALVPMPVAAPIWIGTTDKVAYLLVVYDRNGKVTAYDTGYYVEYIAGEYRQPEKRDAQAGGFLFESRALLYDYDPANEWLYAPLEETDAVLSTPPQKGHCTLFVTNEVSNIRLLIDDEVAMEQSWCTEENQTNGFISLPLTAGMHQIKVLPPSRLDYTGELKSNVDCQEGQRYFAEIESELVHSKSYFKPFVLTGHIQITDTPTPLFRERRLILFHNNRWIGPEKTW